ncbi:MAG: hypothetical protein JNM61_09115 [Zoogloeaceae bacterium]|nr:hypothetical protein [Zoogloeaceae bacterium]
MLSPSEIAACHPWALDFGGRASWRVRIVADLVEINSLHLRGETRRAGADIQLQGALDSADSVIDEPVVEGLRAFLQKAEDDLAALERRREELLMLLDTLNAAEAVGGEG